jgi:hypothetical protein
VLDGSLPDRPKVCVMPVATRRRCANCGASVRVRDRFCPSCGTQLDTTAPRPGGQRPRALRSRSPTRTSRTSASRGPPMASRGQKVDSRDSVIRLTVPGLVSDTTFGISGRGPTLCEPPIHIAEAPRPTRSSVFLMGQSRWRFGLRMSSARPQVRRGTRLGACAVLLRRVRLNWKTTLAARTREDISRHPSDKSGFSGREVSKTLGCSARMYSAKRPANLAIPPGRSIYPTVEGSALRNLVLLQARAARALRPSRRAVVGTANGQGLTSSAPERRHNEILGGNRRGCESVGAPSCVSVSGSDTGADDFDAGPRH